MKSLLLAVVITLALVLCIPNRVSQTTNSLDIKVTLTQDPAKSHPMTDFDPVGWFDAFFDHLTNVFWNHVDVCTTQSCYH